MSRGVKFLWFIACGAIVIGAIYALAFIYTTRSEAFEFASSQIVASDEYEPIVGKIAAVNVDALAGFNHKFSGDNRDASFVVKVIGEKKAIRLHLKLRKRSGQWTIVEAEIIPLRD